MTIGFNIWSHCNIDTNVAQDVGVVDRLWGRLRDRDTNIAFYSESNIIYKSLLSFLLSSRSEWNEEREFVAKTLANRRKKNDILLATAQMFNGNAVALHKSIGNSGNSCIRSQKFLNSNLFLYEYLKCKRSWDSMTALMTYIWMACVHGLQRQQCSALIAHTHRSALADTTALSGPPLPEPCLESWKVDNFYIYLGKMYSIYCYMNTNSMM